jgi:ADP-heptose:LPS heptosyltransferase
MTRLPALDEAERQPRLTVTPSERDWATERWGTTQSPRVLINISAGDADRVWPDERYVAVMEHVLTRSPQATIKVIASPAEAARGESIARDGGGEFVRTRTIRDAMALISTADFVFTPDTSIAHAASAFQRPAVAIYGRGKMAAWALYGTIGRSVEHTDRLPELGLERVLTAIDDVWDEARLSRG